MLKRAPVLALAGGLLICTASAAAGSKEFRYTVGPGCSVSVVNLSGPVVVQAVPGSTVVITATTESNQVEIHDTHQGNRIELRTHLLQRGGSARVDYEVQVPPDGVVTIRSGDGPLRASELEGDLSVQGESAQVELRDLWNAHVHVHTVDGPITLQNLRNSHVDVTTVAGRVALTEVSGPKVAVNTSSGLIQYSGDFGGNGDYAFMTHSGNIEVGLPAGASVDIMARSVNGKVQNEFPLEAKPNTAFAPVEGHSFAGRANSGGSSVRLSSFSGTITVKKQ
ncbi:MAG: DUF4097 domain-containing protein [Terriglobales bacterium]